MTQQDDPITMIEPDFDAIDAMGRRAGAELRHVAPPNGVEDAVRSARRRSTVRGVAVGGVIAAVALIGVVVMNGNDDSTPLQPVDSIAPAPDSVASSVPLAPIPLADSLGAIVFSTLEDLPAGSEGRDVFTADADGSNVRLVAKGWDGFGLSPDGTQLLGTKIATDGRRLPYIIDVGATEGRFIEPSDPNLNLGGLSWSPDGTRFVGEGFNGDDLSKRGVWSMAIDGSDLVRLTDPGTKVDIPPSEGAAYSPDGTRILFYRSEEGDDRERMQMMTMNTDGTDVRQISDSKYRTETGRARWSPDGSKLAYIMFEGDGTASAEKVRALFVADAAGGAPKQVTGWSEYHDFDWSPDGTQFALSKVVSPAGDGKGELQIHTMNADGIELKQVVTPDSSSIWSVLPEWSPDGRSIMFVQGSGDPRRYEYRVLNVDSGVITTVLPAGEEDYAAVWVQAGG